MTSRQAQLIAAVAFLPRPRGALNFAPRSVLRATSARACAAPGTEPQQLSLTLHGAEDTLALGATLATLARAGDAVLLHGDYGAGKTCLARGFLRHWYSGPSEQVTSPSYLIDNVYDDPDGYALLPGVTVHHMDLWRLPEGKIAQLVDLPHVFANCVSLIEWPQRLGDELTPACHLDLRLAIAGSGGGGGESDAAAAAARPAPGEADAADDEPNPYEDEQPRHATLTAKGEAWAERLEEIRRAMEERE